MSDIEEFVHEQDELDYPLRVIIVINSPSHPDGEMEERNMDSIQSFTAMNDFFDNFDEQIAIPNEGHIKYEVGSDGLVVIIVDSLKLRDSALTFIDGFEPQLPQEQQQQQQLLQGKDEDEVDEPKRLKKVKV